MVNKCDNSRTTASSDAARVAHTPARGGGGQDEAAPALPLPAGLSLPSPWL